MSFIKDMVKISGNEYAAIVKDGIEVSDVSGFIDTGVYAFNALLSGSIYNGIPNNKIVALAGSSATGKTFICLNMIKTFLDDNKDGICIYFDSEMATNKEMIEQRGIDTSRIAHMSVATLEEFRHQALKILDNYIKMPLADRKPMIFALDSIGNLSSNKELADTAYGKDTRDMTKAQVAKATFRVLTQKLGKAGVPMIVTAHTYKEIGTMYPREILAGGEALRYNASTIVFLSKRKEKDGDNKVVGNVLHCKLDKSRFTKENSLVDILLRYDTGLNKYYGLLPIAEKYGIFKKVSTRYEMPDGSKVFEKTILENPEKYYTKDILDKIDAVVKKEFCYGSSDDSVTIANEEAVEEEAE